MSESNQAQIELWNGRVGEKWAALQTRMDIMLAAATAHLTARAGSVAGLRVLDIGCGNGVTCAAWLAGGAQVTGVDVSEAMLAVAAQRTAGKATLIQADASVWKGEAPFDLAVSQFGVMFFAEPYAAFANIASNLRAGGRLLFVCWRSVKENPWVTIPMGAIRDLLPESPPPAPHAPGPFGLSDRERLADIVARAGFTNITIDAADIPVCFADEGGVESAVRFTTQIGPAAAALGEMSDEIRTIGAERLRNALAPLEQNGKVITNGAIWIVDAAKP
jgi:SAM-dependent methyltransferase